MNGGDWKTVRRTSDRWVLKESHVFPAFLASVFLGGILACLIWEFGIPPREKPLVVVYILLGLVLIAVLAAVLKSLVAPKILIIDRKSNNIVFKPLGYASSKKHVFAFDEIEYVQLDKALVAVPSTIQEGRRSRQKTQVDYRVGLRVTKDLPLSPVTDRFLAMVESIPHPPEDAPPGGLRMDWLRRFPFAHGRETSMRSKAKELAQFMGLPVYDYLETPPRKKESDEL